MTKIYALYKGNKLIATGTKIQIAYQTNVKLRTIEFFLTPTYKKRCINSKNRKELIPVE